MMFGDSFMEMLIKQSAACLKCGRSFTFEEGGTCARNSNINDNVLKCPYCGRVYTVDLVPGRLTLTRDVTDKYKR